MIRVLQALRSISEAAGLPGLGWEQVNRGDEAHGGARAVATRSAAHASCGGDEKSIARGHSHATVLTDLEKLRVLDVVPGRKQTDAVRARAVAERL